MPSVCIIIIIIIIIIYSAPSLLPITPRPLLYSCRGSPEVTDLSALSTHLPSISHPHRFLDRLSSPFLLCTCCRCLCSSSQLDTPQCSSSHPDAPLHTSMLLFTPRCSSSHLDAPLHTSMLLFTPRCSAPAAVAYACRGAPTRSSPPPSQSAPCS